MLAQLADDVSRRPCRSRRSPPRASTHHLLRPKYGVPSILRNLEGTGPTVGQRVTLRPAPRHRRGHARSTGGPDDRTERDRIPRAGPPPVPLPAGRAERHRPGSRAPVRRRRVAADGRVAVAVAVDHRRDRPGAGRSRATPNVGPRPRRRARPRRLRRFGGPGFGRGRLRVRRHHDHRDQRLGPVAQDRATAGPARSSVDGDTTITRAGTAITLGDLKVGDEIRFRQERQTTTAPTRSRRSTGPAERGRQVTAIEVDHHGQALDGPRCRNDSDDPCRRRTRRTASPVTTRPPCPTSRSARSSSRRAPSGRRLARRRGGGRRRPRPRRLVRAVTARTTDKTAPARAIRHPG